MGCIYALCRSAKNHSARALKAARPLQDWSCQDTTGLCTLRSVGTRRPPASVDRLCSAEIHSQWRVEWEGAHDVGGVDVLGATLLLRF